MIRIELFNGSRTKDAWDPDSPDYIDDWKPENATIDADSVQITYGTTVTLIRDGEDTVYLFEDDLLVVDGVYYGDFTISAAGGGAV